MSNKLWRVPCISITKIKMINQSTLLHFHAIYVVIYIYIYIYSREVFGVSGCICFHNNCAVFKINVHYGPKVEFTCLHIVTSLSDHGVAVLQQHPSPCHITYLPKVWLILWSVFSHIISRLRPCPLWLFLSKSANITNMTLSLQHMLSFHCCYWVFIATAITCGLFVRQVWNVPQLV